MKAIITITIENTQLAFQKLIYLSIGLTFIISAILLYNKISSYMFAIFMMDGILFTALPCLYVIKYRHDIFQIIYDDNPYTMM